MLGRCRASYKCCLLLLRVEVLWRHHSIISEWRSLLIRSSHHLLMLIRINWSLLLHHHSLLHHLLLVLLLLYHHDFLSMLPKCHFLLLVNELEKLFPSHRKDLIQSTKHESLKEFIWDTQNRRTVRLDLLMKLVATIENEFMLLMLLLLRLSKDSWLKSLLRSFLHQLLSHLCLHILWNSSSLRIQNS